MSQPSPSAVPAALRVAAGTTAAAALEAAGVRTDGPSGAIVVRELPTGALRDLAWSPAADTDVEPVPMDSADGRAVLRHSTAHVLAQAVQDLFPGTLLGIGPPIDNGFYYDFLPERPFTPEDLARVERRMQEIVKAAQRFSPPAGVGRAGARRAGARAVQARADRPQGRRGRHRGRVRGGRRRPADHVRQPRPVLRRAGVDRPVPRSAPADHPADPGVQDHPLRGGVLAGQREEPAAPADLRHRLGVQGRAGRAPAAARGGGEARPPPARRGAGPVQLPDRAGVRPRDLPPEGRHHPARDGGILAPPARAVGLRVRQLPAHHQGRPLPHLGAPAELRGHHVPADAPSRARTTTSSR